MYNRKMTVYESKHEPDLAYWDLGCLKKLLSHNADVTIVSSPRSAGKSYACMQLVSEGIARGEWSVWERYNTIELSQAIATWEQFAPHLTREALGSKGGIVLRDEETGGGVVLIAYNRPQNVKGLDMNFRWEIKDEFIPERYTEKTRLDTEFADSMSVYKSVKRSNPTRSIYLCNCIQWINPYTIAWNLPPVDRGTILKVVDTESVSVDGVTHSAKRTIIWENVALTSAMIARNLQGDLVAMSGAGLEDYYHNVTKAEYSRIARCPNPEKQPENLHLFSDGYTLGFRVHDGCIWFFKAKDRSDIQTLVGEPAYIDLEHNRIRSPSATRQFADHFNNGRCIFDSAESLVAFQRWLYHSRQML